MKNRLQWGQPTWGKPSFNERKANTANVTTIEGDASRPKNSPSMLDRLALKLLSVRPKLGD